MHTSAPTPSAQHRGGRRIARPLRRKVPQQGGTRPPCNEADYPFTTGFTAKMPLKLLRYCRKTSTHSTQATSAGAMPGGQREMEGKNVVTAPPQAP